MEGGEVGLNGSEEDDNEDCKEPEKSEEIIISYYVHEA